MNENTPIKIGPLTIRPFVRNGCTTGQWHMDIPARLMPNGQRRRKLFDTKREAVETARRLKNGLENRSLGVVETRRTMMLFREVVAQWIEHEELRVHSLKKRASSLETEKYRLKALLPEFGAKDIAEITVKDVEAYQARRLKIPRRPATVNGEVRALMIILNWAAREGMIKNVPKVELIPDHPRKIDLPTVEETIKILEALPTVARSVVCFIALTGCRSGEAFNLTWDAVDFEQGVIRIQSREGWTPKTMASERSIPMTEALLEMLRVTPRHGTYVFPSRDDPNQPRDNVRKALNSATQRAGVVRNGQPMHVTPKMFRKAFATQHSRSGTPQPVLQSLLGHAPGSRITNQYYVQATEEDKRVAMEASRLGQISITS